MINDQSLYEYLYEEDVTQLAPINLNLIGNNGEYLQTWGLHFNQLSEDDMYHELKYVISQLIIVEMSEEKRLELMEAVLKVGQRLISILHISYWNHAGLLNEEQQYALDRVLSIYYLGVMLYYTVWQRLAPQIQPDNQQSGLSLLWRFTKNNISHNELAKRCLHSIVALLRQALLEKHVGYRQDTQVIWHYLNACYRFALGYQWQDFSSSNPVFMNKQTSFSVKSLYYQCLLSEIINPYGYRRHDLIALNRVADEWTNYLTVANEPLTEPFLYLDLQGNKPPCLLHAKIAFNPFSENSQCLFIGLEGLTNKLIEMSHTPIKEKNDVIKIRLAKLTLKNLQQVLRPPVDFTEDDEECQIVFGFHHIHYLLAGKSSLGNLIHGHLLPERLRPIQMDTNFKKPMTAKLFGKYQQYRQLTWQFTYNNDETLTSHERTYSSQQNPIIPFQVHSMMAILTHDHQGKKSWQLGQVQCLKQQPMMEDFQPTQQHLPADTQQTQCTLDIEICVDLVGNGIVPCGVRILNHESRPPRFKPALIIPQSPEKGRAKTSLMMARFGYQLEDKLIVRIDNKEVTVHLTELINMTDDVEEYAFVRIQ